MVLKASDGPVPLARSRKGVRSHAPLPPQKKCFTFFPLKRHFQHSWDLKSVVKACYKIWSLFSFLSQKPKNNNAWLERIAVWLFVVSLHTSALIKQRSLKESSRMSFYKGLAYLVNLESFRVMHSNDSEIWKALFRHRRPGAGLDPFHERKGPLSLRTTDW